MSTSRRLPALIVAGVCLGIGSLAASVGVPQASDAAWTHEYAGSDFSDLIPEGAEGGCSVLEKSGDTLTVTCLHGVGGEQGSGTYTELPPRIVEEPVRNEDAYLEMARGSNGPVSDAELLAEGDALCQLLDASSYPLDTWAEHIDGMKDRDVRYEEEILFTLCPHHVWMTV